MKSTYNIIWSDNAVSGLTEIIRYIEREFSEKDVRIFIRKFEKQLDLIKLNPYSFPVSAKSKTVRRALIARLTSVYFSVENDSVRLISVYDNRKSPDNLRT